MWTDMSEPAKEAAIRKWGPIKVRREIARQTAGIGEHVSPADIEAYDICIRGAQQRLAVPIAPAMAIDKPGEPKGSAMSLGPSFSKPVHEEHLGGIFEASDTFNAMVHTPVPIPKALLIPDAKAALDKEYDKLNRIEAWDMSKVQSKRVIQEKAKRTGKTIHIGELMELCHLKNSQLEKKISKV